MITEKEFLEAQRVVLAYKQQLNKALVSSRLIGLADFYKIEAVKHHAELTCDDIVVLAIDQQNLDKGFEKVFCTGYCGKDEFWGRNEDGKERAWCDNDTFKIIGKQISVSYRALANGS
jgi:hypothetical protein